MTASDSRGAPKPASLSLLHADTLCRSVPCAEWSQETATVFKKHNAVNWRISHESVEIFGGGEGML